jgi:hypothetical protein
MLVCSVVVTLSAAVACGGGGDGDGGGFGNFGAENTPGAADSSNGNGGSGGNGDSGGNSSGETGPAPDVNAAAPGEARIDVEGGSLVYGGADLIYYTCDTSTGVLANFQTPDGHDLSFQYQGGFGNLTARDQENDLYYAASISNGEGVWIEGNTVIYQGQLQKQQGSNRLESEDIDGTLVINCDPPGGENARAEIDGTVYEIPASGTQSYVCMVGDQVTVNIQPQLGGPALQVDSRKQGEITLGSISLRLDDTTYFSQIPDDGEGLEVDSKRVTYLGLFELRSNSDRTVLEEDVQGTVSVVCP